MTKLNEKLTVIDIFNALTGNDFISDEAASIVMDHVADEGHDFNDGETDVDLVAFEVLTAEGIEVLTDESGFNNNGTVTVIS